MRWAVPNGLSNPGERCRPVWMSFFLLLWTHDNGDDTKLTGVWCSKRCVDSDKGLETYLLLLLLPKMGSLSQPDP